MVVLSIWFLQAVASLALLSVAEERDNALLLQRVFIVDPAAGEVSSPTNLLIDDGVIVDVAESIAVDGDIHVIDCEGMFALPGLFDCHTHVVHLTESDDDSTSDALARFVANGVLFLRDVGGPIEVLADLHARIRRGDMIGPEIFYTGPMLEQSPLTWERVNEEHPGFSVAIDTRDAVDSVLTLIAARGGCCIKTFNEVSPEMYRYVVSVADSLGLRVVHDPGTPLFHRITIDSALAWGVTSFEHAKAPWPVILRNDVRGAHDSLSAIRADQATRLPVESRIVMMGAESVAIDRLHDVARSMIAHDAYLCPTLTVFADIDAVARQVASEMYEGEGAPPEMMLNMIKSSVTGLDAVGRLCVSESARIGVKMLVGQDGDDPDATIGEMLLMREAGVSNLEILRGATVYPARWLGIENRIGSLDPGKEATLIVVENNPLDDINALSDVKLVIQRGIVVELGVAAQ
jgi:hypothetical protein